MKYKLYELNPSKPHYLINVNGKCGMIDTGYPSSERALNGQEAELMAEFIGRRVDFIYGISKFKNSKYLKIDIENKEVSIGDINFSVENNKCIPFEYFCGFIKINVLVNGKKEMAILDTGAWKSVVHPKYLEEQYIKKIDELCFNGTQLCKIKRCNIELDYIKIETCIEMNEQIVNNQGRFAKIFISPNDIVKSYIIFDFERNKIYLK